jgi:hypothetical protein
MVWASPVAAADEPVGGDGDPPTEGGIPVVGEPIGIGLAAWSDLLDWRQLGALLMRSSAIHTRVDRTDSLSRIAPRKSTQQLIDHGRSLRR